MPESTVKNYLDPQTLAAIRPIELRARMIVEGLMQGMHRSPYQGFSVEFAQHRQYAPGDDTRFLDWKVFGKTDKLYLKQFQKETNLDLLVMVDVSGSMAYSSLDGSPGSIGWKGPWSKFDHAASLAAAMSFIALRQQDRVGLMLFSSAVRSRTRLSNARDHWWSIVEMLHSAELDQRGEPARVPVARGGWSRGQTDLPRLFDQVMAQLSRRSLLVLISDLFDPDETTLERALARLHHRQHDVVLLQTLDPAELSFPFRVATDLVGLEAEGRLSIDPTALRQFYLDELQTHLEQVERVAHRFRFDYLRVDTSQPLGPPLSHFLARRAAGIAKGRSAAAVVT